MNTRLEDRAGKILLLSAFGFLAVNQLIAAIIFVKAHGWTDVLSVGAVAQLDRAK